MFCCISHKVLDNDYVRKLHILFIAPAISIVSSPTGTAVSGSDNTFDYPILSSVRLMCQPTPPPEITVNYSWNTTRCYTHGNYSHGTPSCFPNNVNMQSVTGSDLTAVDGGTVTCTVTIDGHNYTSGPFTLRVSGM